MIELALPLLFSAILIALRHRVESENFPNSTHYDPMQFPELPNISHTGFWELAYVPSHSDAVRGIVMDVEKKLGTDIRGKRYGADNIAFLSLWYV